MPISDIMYPTPHLAFGLFSTLIGSDVGHFAITEIKNTLLAAGWTITGHYSAIASITFPLGVPIGGLLLADNRIAGFVGNIELRWFDPIGGTDPTGLLDGTFTVLGVPTSLTGDGSAANLAAKIETLGWIVWIEFTPPVTYTFHMISLAPGTAGNGIYVDGNGSFSTGSGFSGGGGYLLTSRTQKDDDPTSSNDTRTRISVTGADPTFGFSNLNLQVQVDGLADFEFQFAQGGHWLMVASDYNVFFRSTDPFHAGDDFVFNTFLYCGNPVRVPPGLIVNPVGIIWAGGGTVTTLGIGVTQSSAQTIVNSRHGVNIGTGQLGMSFCFYHYQYGAAGANNLVTRMKKSLLLPALLMMPVHPDSGPDESRIVGFMWNAFLDTRYAKEGGFVRQSGEIYRASMSQFNGAIGTLYLRWPSGTIPIGDPEPPPPQTLKGTGNALGFGLTWLSGDPFLPIMTGEPIWINGIEFIVDQVQDAGFLTLTTAAPLMQFANWHT